MRIGVLILSALVISITSCSDKTELIIGKWKKVRSDKQGREEWAFSPAILVFRQDNSFEAGKFSLDNSKIGTWKFNETSDSLIINEENKKEPEALRLIKLTQDSLILISSEYKSYFKKQ